MDCRARRAACVYNRSCVVPPVIAEVLSAYRARLEQEFPARLERVTLFGSTARGEATEASDVDVLGGVDGLTFPERSRALDPAAETGLPRVLVLEPIVLTASEWADLERREIL